MTNGNECETLEQYSRGSRGVFCGTGMISQGKPQELHEADSACSYGDGACFGDCIGQQCPMCFAAIVFCCVDPQLLAVKG
ncbi:hypothetical protein AC249_AIPGENE6222 [Exaiptasia diaphana]|nr:hypothetical protein AC249_AIPGENE6222 [Exaiptasia diaphana]